MDGGDERQSVDIRAAGFVGSMPAFAKELLAGGVAGGSAKTVVAPLDRVKILLQTRKAEFQSVGVIGTFQKVARKEGVAGFYRGNGASVARIVPYAALHYMVYEEYRGLLVKLHPRLGTGPILDFVAGSFAGGTAVISTYPLDLIRTKLAFQVVESPHKLKANFSQPSTGLVYKGILDCFSRTYKEAGIRGLYRGVAPTLCGIFPYSGLKFYAYEAMKSRVAEEHKRDITVKLACGSFAGLLGQTFTYPFEVVRRQMQVQTLTGTDGGDVRGTVETFFRIVRGQGWRQLFSGLTINYFKVVPSAAIGFTVYDVMKSILGVPPREITAVQSITTTS